MMNAKRWETTLNECLKDAVRGVTSNKTRADLRGLIAEFRALAARPVAPEKKKLTFEQWWNKKVKETGHTDPYQDSYGAAEDAWKAAQENK